MVFLIKSVSCLLVVLLVVINVNGRSTKYKELKPVLIKSVVSHPRIPYSPPNNNLEEGKSSQEFAVQHEEGRSSRKIYQFPGPGGHQNMQRGGGGPPPQNDQERGQILHRPKSGRRNTQTSSSSQSHYQNQDQNDMPNDAPMILGGKGKKVKYVPTMGGYQGQGPEKPPQVYVISGGGDDDDESSNGGGNGVVGSMQTYFKSMTGRIRAAFQGLIGGITD